MEENLVKKSKNTNSALQIFLILIIILGVCGISYFIYENALKEENLEQENGNEEEKKYTLDIYKYNSTGDICGSQTSYCSEIAFSIETETENATFIGVDYEKYLFVLYRDNGLKLYNVETKEIIKVNLEDNYKHYSIYLNNKKDKVAGIIYQLENNTFGYYNVLQNIKLYEGKYTYLSYLDENYLFGSTSKSGIIEFKDCLLNANKEFEELSNEVNEPTTGTIFFLESYNGKYYFFESYPDGTIGKIYSNNKKIIYENSNSLERYKYSVIDGILYLVDENVVKKYDTSGNLISTSDSIENIKQIISNYVVYEKNNQLYLYNVNTKDTIKIVDLKSIQEKN